MSNAHRPTWAPAAGRESKMGSSTYRQVDYSSRTKLKFRAPGQGGSEDIEKRDLKAELLRAEREAQNRKRKAKGLPLLPEPEVDTPRRDNLAIEGVKTETSGTEAEEDPAAKRRRLLEEVARMDADDSDDDDDEPEETTKWDRKGKGKEVAQDGDDANRPNGNGAAGRSENGDNDENDSDDSSDDDSDDDEDDTAALMAELEKIKRERAEEKERQEREAAAANAVDRDMEIATGNPLLNLEAALGRSPSTSSTGTGTTGNFAVKRRWDDDLIFKNQAMGADDKPKKEFVNDLLRSEFHRKFMSKFIR